MNEKDRIILLYQNIDQRKWMDVLAVFDDAIQYTRSESTSEIKISTKEELRNFYQNIRDMQGSHTIQEIKVANGKATVKGEFQGERNSQPIRLRYIDEFIFNSTGLITTRRSVIEEV